ncbi:MAG: hypothetical protein U0Y68_21105 [Blastocatellia bacterium]
MMSFPYKKVVVTGAKRRFLRGGALAGAGLHANFHSRQADYDLVQAEAVKGDFAMRSRT